MLNASSRGGVTAYAGTLLATALPIVLQTLLFSSRAFVDVFLLGQTDTDSVAAIGLAGRLMMVVIVLLASLAIGGGYVSSQCAGDRGKLATSTTLTLIVTLLAALLATAVVAAAHGPLLGLATQDEGIRALAWRYLAIMCLTFPLMGFSAVAGSFLRILGAARHVLVASLVGLAVNVLTTLWFTLGLGAGITGAAWGSVLGILAELGLLVWRLVPVRQGFLTTRNITVARLGIVTTQSLLTGMGSLSWALGAFVFYALLGQAGGDVLYILAILSPLESVLLAFSLGLSTASGIELAKCIPTHARQDIHTRAHLSLALSLGVALILVAIVLLVHCYRPGLFFDVSRSVDFNRFLALMLLAVLLKSLSIQLISGVLRCGGDARFCFALDFFTQWSLILPVASLMVWLQLPPLWIYASVLVEEAVKVGLAWTRFRSDRWRRDLTAGG